MATFTAMEHSSATDEQGRAFYRPFISRARATSMEPLCAPARMREIPFAAVRETPGL
jgi:hypothetical protein